MSKLLSSEWLRTKRTAIRWLTFCMPVFFSLCAVAYLVGRTGGTEEFAFEGFFTLWTVFIIPLGVGILAGFVVHEEEPAGNFNGFLCFAISRTKLYLGKFLLLLFCLTACTMTAALILCIGMEIWMPAGAHIWLFMVAALLAIVGLLPLLAVHLGISFMCGMGASIGISMGGILMAALLGLTGPGSKVWPFVPWTWPIKLGMLPGSYFLKETVNASTSRIISETMHTAFIGLVAVVVGLGVSLIGGIIWFNRWEGRKGYE